MHPSLLLVSLCLLFAKARLEDVSEVAQAYEELIWEDIQNHTVLYDRLLDEELAVGVLKNGLRRELTTKNVNYLVNLMSGKDRLAIDNKLKDTIGFLNSNYDAKLVQNILLQSLEQLYIIKSPTDTLDLLWQLADERSKQGLELIIHLHKRLLQLHQLRSMQLDLSFMIKMALALDRVQKHNFYYSVNGYAKQQLGEAVKKLPSTLRYLLFEPYFCLQNLETEEFLYTTMSHKFDVDENTRKVFTWSDKSIDQAGNIRGLIMGDGPGNETSVWMEMFCVSYGFKYFRMQSSNILAAWQSKYTPTNSLFRLKLLNAKEVALMQDEYHICAGDRSDSHRREVKGYTDRNWMLQSCQWILGECKR